VTVVVDVEGSQRPGGQVRFTSPKKIAGTASVATKCAFYGLNEANQGGGIDAEVHLLVPHASLQSVMSAIWSLPGVTGTRVLVWQDFGVAPTGPAPVDEPVDCGKATGVYAS